MGARQPPAAAVLATAILIASSACRRAETPPPQSASPATPAAAPASVPHGDHNPRHGGIVMMKGDLHYEVVLDPTGRAHRLYFSDAVRDELPASVASNAALTIHRAAAVDEHVPLQIDGEGDSWTGTGRPAIDPAHATATLTFTIHGEPYTIDLPFVTAGGTGPSRTP